MEEENLDGVDLAVNTGIEEEEAEEQIEEKSKLDELILQKTAGIKLGNSISIMNTLDLVGLGEGQAKLMLGDVVVGVVQNGKIEYSKKPEIQEILKMLNVELQLQKQNQQNQGEREEEKEPGTIHDDNEDPEVPETPKELEDGENEQSYEERNNIKRDSGWIEIRSDREIDEMRTFIGAIKKEYPKLGEINRAFIAPDKNNPNSYKLYVQGKKGKITKVPLETTEGVNPMHENVTTIGNDGTKATKKTPIQILKINNRNMLMIFNGGKTTTSIHIANRSDGDNYTSTQISAIDSQNKLNDPNEDVKKQVSSSEGQQQEGDEQERAFAIIKNFEKQNLPDEINPAKDKNGVEVKEIGDFPTAMLDGLKHVLNNAFQDVNITVSKKAIETMAISIIQGKKFKDAVIEGMRIEEQEGRIPPYSAEKVGANISDAIARGDSDKARDEEELGRGDPRSH